MLPPEIWNKIFYFAFSYPDTHTLDICREVCRDWNKIIKKRVWLSPNKEWGMITKRMIERKWVPSTCEICIREYLECTCQGNPRSFPSDQMISHAKGLGKRKKNI